MKSPLLTTAQIKSVSLCKMKFSEGEIGKKFDPRILILSFDARKTRYPKYFDHLCGAVTDCH